MIIRAMFQMFSAIVDLDTAVRHIITNINNYFDTSAGQDDSEEEDDE
jgi:hypothetical protein